jgi:AraC family transcriptional regulator
MRLYREYRLEQDACTETRDSLVWEMLASTAQWKAEKTVPRWWPRVEEFLHECFRGPVSLNEIAAEVGVHPVHVTRVCRRQQGRTIGEYLQGLRLQYACELLVKGEMPVSEIAADAGFSDQSHLTRMMQRYARVTPAALRKMVRSEWKKSG